MQEIYPKLFIGPQEDCDSLRSGRDANWWILHATHEPCHRRFVGYEGSTPAPEHPEYLHARRGQELSLNLVDAMVEVEFPTGLFEAALDFVQEALNAGGPLLIHCNRGVSRSAGIGFLYLGCHTTVFRDRTYKVAAACYEREHYPPFNPGRAVRAYLSANFESLRDSRRRLRM